MPSYKLTYFNGRGRGECSRMLLAAAGQKFEDVRVPFEDWPKVKPTTPQGVMPILEVDGKLKLSQSTTIARYLARELKLYGKDNVEAALIDQIFDTIVGLFDSRITFIFSDKSKKDELIEQFAKEKLPGYLDILEKLTTGKDFAVGSSLSLADIALYVYIEATKSVDQLSKYPKLKANRAKVAANPKIKAYLASRPVTEF